LKAQSYPASLTTVFLVHNGSAAAQRQQAAQLAPEARHLTLARNRGWTGGNNAAIRVALSEAFAYVVMLNVDTVVDRGWLSGLVQAADEHPTIHIWQSRILLHGTTKINSLGNRIHYLGFGYCHGYGQPQTTSSSAAMVDYASGAAMLVKREVFETIGLFREDYMSYYDDMEFCWRARLVGYNVGVADASLCYHKYTFRKSPTRLYYLQRNRLMTLFSLERWGTLLMTLPCLLVAEGVLTGYFLARGWGRTQRRLWRSVCSPATWRLVAAHRRHARTLRRRKDAEIVKRFAATVVFPELDHPVLRYVLNPLLWLYWTTAKRFIVW